MRKRNAEPVRVKVARASVALERAALKLVMAKYGPRTGLGKIAASDMDALQAICTAIHAIAHDRPVPSCVKGGLL